MGEDGPARAPRLEPERRPLEAADEHAEEDCRELLAAGEEGAFELGREPLRHEQQLDETDERRDALEDGHHGHDPADTTLTGRTRHRHAHHHTYMECPLSTA